jgi:hypothetical protein
MNLEHRVFLDYFGLLFPIIIATTLIIYVKRTRSGLVESILLGLFNKVLFKTVQKNIDERGVTILFWSSVFLQATYIYSIVLKSNTNLYLVYLLVILAILLKGKTLKFSGAIFQKEDIFKDYITSFYITVINLGLFTIPLTAINIVYLNKLTKTDFLVLNRTFIIIILTYLIIRVVFLALAAVREKISYLHIIVYLCTLEILPFVIISYYFFK